MATTPVIVHSLQTSQSGLTLELYALPKSGDTDPSIANGAGDTLSEQNCPGWYKADVDESLVGVYRAVVKSSDGTVLAHGLVQMEDTTKPVYDTDAKIALSVGSIEVGTVDTITNTHTPTTTEFQADDITEATEDHYKNRFVVFTSGALLKQVAEITAYELVFGIGQFTVSALTEAPSDDDTFIII